MGKDFRSYWLTCTQLISVPSDSLANVLLTNFQCYKLDSLKCFFCHQVGVSSSKFVMAILLYLFINTRIPHTRTSQSSNLIQEYINHAKICQKSVINPRC